MGFRIKETCDMKQNKMFLSRYERHHKERKELAKRIKQERLWRRNKKLDIFVHLPV
jgi:hypothetical protein